MSSLVTPAQIAAAAEGMRGRVRVTPCEYSPQLSARWGVELYAKLENFQVTGSFKARGAHHFIARALTEAAPVRGVITYSSGNHGRAVAEAAAAHELPALITVPESIDGQKARAIDAAGAERIVAGNTSESRKSRALEIAAERGWTIVPPFDHDWIIEGQSTVAAEVLEDCPEVTDLWAPVGGGGLSAGSALAISTLAPHVQLHTVEPEGAPGYAQSAAAGERVTLPATDSIADGLLPLVIGERNWAWLHRVGANPHLVEDGRIARVLGLFHEEFEIPAEPSGVVSSVPLLDAIDSDPIEPGVHVAIVSGGNIDPARLARLLGKAST